MRGVDLPQAPPIIGAMPEERDPLYDLFVPPDEETTPDASAREGSPESAPAIVPPAGPAAVPEPKPAAGQGSPTGAGAEPTTPAQAPAEGPAAP